MDVISDSQCVADTFWSGWHAPSNRVPITPRAPPPNVGHLITRRLPDMVDRSVPEKKIGEDARRN